MNQTIDLWKWIAPLFYFLMFKSFKGQQLFRKLFLLMLPSIFMESRFLSEKKVAHNRPRPFYSTVQPRPQPTAQNWFSILWNLGTRHLFSYLWCRCINIGMFPKIVHPIVKSLLLLLVMILKQNQRLFELKNKVLWKVLICSDF